MLYDGNRGKGGMKVEAIVELLGIVVEFIGWGEPPDGQRIEANIAALMSFSWFAELVEKPQYDKLVQENPSVRYVIGKMRMKKMKKSVMYEERKERKLKKVLNKQLGGQARA